MISKSPKRNTFQKEAYIKRKSENNEPVNNAYVEMWETQAELTAKQEANPEWQKNNLEYDLRSTKWICDKAKANENYAQNVYAALCNQSWKKNEVWFLIKGETWSCTWRYAGGIVADMVEQGDYIDWYCSGITGGDEPDVYNNVKLPRDFVPEGTVTDEIRADFFKLGWIPVESPE